MQDLLCYYDLEGLGRKIEKGEKVLKLLRSLMPMWMMNRIIFEEIRPKDLNELMGALEAYEMGMKQVERTKEMKKMNNKSIALMASSSSQ